MTSANDRPMRAAIYARVSSDRQAHEGTIDSQAQALRERVGEEGLTLDEELCFIDDGFTGSTLVRPALERLRDQAAAGAIDRLYIHSPDRLARRYAHQALLVDELQQCGVELVFLNRPLGRGPEDDLLLQVQGVVADGTLPSRKTARGSPRLRQRPLPGSVWLPICKQALGRRRGTLRSVFARSGSHTRYLSVGRQRTDECQSSGTTAWKPRYFVAARSDELGPKYGVGNPSESGV